MRRGLAGLILGLSLVLASVSWAGFVLTNTVLDPGRSERLADQLLDNEVLRSALVGRLVAGMEATLPPEVPVPRQQLELAATAALDDPRVDALVREGIVKVHRNALDGSAEPVTLDASALGAASRDALVGVRPELATVLPEAPPLAVELPTGGLSWLGKLRDLASRISLLLGLVAAAGIAISLFVAKNRPAILRRVSVWAFGAAAFWLVVGYGVPFLARTVAPSSTAIISAMIDVFFGAMIRPAAMMGVFGLILLAFSMLWATMSNRRGAALLQPARTQASHGRASRPSPGGATSNIRPTPSPRADPTQVLPVTRIPGPSGPAPAPQPDRPSSPRWVEGQGYVKGQGYVEGQSYVEDPARETPTN